MNKHEEPFVDLVIDQLPLRAGARAEWQWEILGAVVEGR
jgi:hypothetical protein